MVKRRQKRWIGPVAMLVMAAFLAPAAAQVKSFLPDDLGNTAPAPAAGFGDSRDHVKVSVKAGLDQVAVGGEVPIAVVFDHDKKWHIHTNNPNVPPELGDVFVIKTELKVKVEPQGAATAHVGHIQWPKVHMEKVGFGVAPVRLLRGERHARRGVARTRLGQAVLRGQVGQELAHAVGLVGAGHDQRVLRVHQALQPPHGLRQQGLGAADRQELLRQGAPAGGPEARAGAAGHDHGVDVGRGHLAGDKKRAGSGERGGSGSSR